jgi:hypothetical protein
MKKKLRLDPDTLRVVPFEVEPTMEESGTVLGHIIATPAASCGYPRTCGGTSCATGYPVCRACTA